MPSDPLAGLRPPTPEPRDEPAPKPPGQRVLPDEASPGGLAIARALLLHTPDRVDSTSWFGRAATWVLLAVWGAWFVVQPWDAESIGQSFLHRPDLVFHEAGHILFGFFGDWVMFAGGSVMQCLVPAVLIGYFVFVQRQPFSAAVCLWWLGQNAVDLAPYIGDARALAMPLVGEWSEEIVSLRAARHDWRNILAPLGWLEHDRSLGAAAGTLGRAVMVGALGWGAALLRLQWSRRDDGFGDR